MKIVRVLPESLQEFTDHISIVFFVFGCNLRCSFCYNYNFVSDSRNVLDESPYELIDKFANPLTDGLVFLGGEPTIYGKTLFDVAQYGKSRYNLDIKLFTNGTKPKIVLEGLENGSFDFVSIDYKSFNNASGVIDTSRLGSSFEDYHRNLVSLLEQIVARGLSNRVEIRTTQFKGMSDLELSSIQKTCSSLGLTHILQPDMLDEYRASGMLEA